MFEIYQLLCVIVVSIAGLASSVWLLAWLSEHILDYVTTTFKLHSLFKEFMYEKYARKRRQ